MQLTLFINDCKITNPESLQIDKFLCADTLVILTMGDNVFVSFQKHNRGIVMVNFYSYFITCNESASISDVIGKSNLLGPGRCMHGYGTVTVSESHPLLPEYNDNKTHL